MDRGQQQAAQQQTKPNQAKAKNRFINMKTRQTITEWRRQKRKVSAKEPLANSMAGFFFTRFYLYLFAGSFFLLFYFATISGRKSRVRLNCLLYAYCMCASA